MVDLQEDTTLEPDRQYSCLLCLKTFEQGERHA